MSITCDEGSHDATDFFHCHTLAVSLHSSFFKIKGANIKTQENGENIIYLKLH